VIWVMVLGAVAGGLLLVAAFSRGGGKDGARKEVVRREPRREPRSPSSGRESSSASVAATVSILDANVGDRVRLVGAGEHGETIEFDVDRRNRYELDALEWFEVRGRYKGGYVFVEYSDEDDHGLEITANLDSVTYELSRIRRYALELRLERRDQLLQGWPRRP